MFHVKFVGAEKFYRDADFTIATIPHYLMEALDDIGGTIGRLARVAAPGNLGESVGTESARPMGGGRFEGDVGVRRGTGVPKFVHEGTGIYGPLHRPFTITKRQTNFPPNWGIDRTGRRNPAVGNVLKLTARDGEVYFRKSVVNKGQRPQPYLTEAIAIAERSEVPIRVQRLARQIAR